MRSRVISLDPVVPMPSNIILFMPCRVKAEDGCFCAERELSLGTIRCPHGHGNCRKMAPQEQENTAPVHARPATEPIDPNSTLFAEDDLPDGRSYEQALFEVLQRRPGFLLQIYEEAWALLETDAERGTNILTALPAAVEVLADNELFRNYYREHDTLHELKRLGKRCRIARELHRMLAA